MSIIAKITLAGVTPDQYNAVRDRCGHLKDAPVGGQLHAVWWEGNDCSILDAWEDEATFGAFGENILGPAMAAAGVGVEPVITIFPAHEVYAPRAVTVTAA